MSNEKISELPPGSPAESGDALPIARGGANYQIAVSDIAAYCASTITFTGGVAINVGGNTLGTTANLSAGTALFAGGNNITLSQSSNSITIIGAAGGGTGGNSTGGIILTGNTTGTSTGTYAQSNLTMQGAGLISLGFSNGSLVISAPATTGISQSLYATGNTISSSFGTNSIGSLIFSGAGNVSVGITNGSVLISGSGGGGGTGGVGVGVSGGNTSGITGIYTSGNVAFAGVGPITLSQSTGTAGASISINAPSVSTLSGTGNASISVNGSTISLGANAAAISISGNSTSAGAGYSNISTGTAVFAGGNNITLSQNGASISIIGAAGAAGNVYLSAGGNTSGTLALISTGTAVFAGGNNITLSQNGNAITIVGGAGGGLNSGTFYGSGNTTNNSSTTIALSSLVFNAYGAQSVGFSNGSVQLSAPAISSISGTGQVSVSVNGSTISIGVPGSVSMTRSIWPQAQLAAISAPGNASLSVQYVAIDNPVTGSRIDALLGLSGGSSATANTGAIAFSVYMGISTRNGSTLSSLSSGSTQTTFSYASNTAGATQLTASAVRALSCPVNFNMAPGEYYVGVNIITATSSIGASTTNFGLTLSMYGGTDVQTAVPYADMTANTATSNNLYFGQGIFTAATTGMPISLGLSQIAQTGASQAQANIGLVFRNG